MNLSISNPNKESTSTPKSVRQPPLLREAKSTQLFAAKLQFPSPKMDASKSDFKFIDDAQLRSWYDHNGQIPIPTLKRAYTEDKIKEGQMQTPLQLVALIQRGHSVIHKPWWTQVYLPMFCPTKLALDEMDKHWLYYLRRDKARVYNFSLASKKMAFHLGYTIQVFWILATKRPSCTLMVADPQPMHFLKAKPNIKYLVTFFGMLCLELWQQRLYLKLWQQLLCATPTQEKVTVPESMKLESWPLSKNGKGFKDNWRDFEGIVATLLESWPSWRTSKGDNWRDLEGALATLWHIFLSTDRDKLEEAGLACEFPYDLDKLSDWEFIRLSVEEEAWFRMSGDGQGSMSPLALGLQEAERVQRHWEKEKQWVEPMYPAEWEGWAVI